MIPSINRASGARTYVGGATASQVDFSHVLSAKLPLFIGVVIVLAATVFNTTRVLRYSRSDTELGTTAGLIGAGLVAFEALGEG